MTPTPGSAAATVFLQTMKSQLRAEAADEPPPVHTRPVNK